MVGLKQDLATRIILHATWSNFDFENTHYNSTKFSAIVTVGGRLKNDPKNIGLDRDRFIQHSHKIGLTISMIRLCIQNTIDRHSHDSVFKNLKQGLTEQIEKRLLPGSGKTDCSLLLSIDYSLD